MKTRPGRLGKRDLRGALPERTGSVWGSWAAGLGFGVSVRGSAGAAYLVNQLEALRGGNIVETELRCRLANVYGGENPAVKIGSDVFTKLRLGFPFLDIQDGRVSALLLVNPSCQTGGLDLGWPLDRAQGGQDLSPLRERREEPEF